MSQVKNKDNSDTTPAIRGVITPFKWQQYQS